MTRIMQVMAGAVHGGAETFFERLVPALSRAGIEQCAVIRRNETRAALLRDQGIQTTELAFGGRLDLTTKPRLGRLVRDFSPDLQLAWMSRAARFCRPNRHIVAGRLGGYYDLKYFRYCHHLVGNTQDIRDHIIRSGWPPENAWYLPNFVDGTRQLPVDRQTLNTPNEAPVVLALGRLHPNKGFDVLLTALQRVPDAILWLGGTGPEEESLKAQALHLGIADRVRFLGWRRDMPALLAAADLLVCSSRHEPLGNVVIEAWAHDVPVVATASTGPAGLIEDRVTGLLVPVDDAVALSSAMSAVLRDKALAGELSEAGHAAYDANFTERSVVDQYREFFDRVA
ncbi:MAG: glycosyltransferase [Pseudomonadota bacterium]